MEQGRYLYCITDAHKHGELAPTRPFGGFPGMGGAKVSIVTYKDISAVVSDCPVKHYSLTRENLMTHQRVIEYMITYSTALPVRFSTIADSPEGIAGILEKRYAEFKELLSNMNGKTELGIKAIWKDMSSIFNEIAESPGITKLKERLMQAPRKAYMEKVTLGKLVEVMLKKKKEEYAQEILSNFIPLASDVHKDKIYGDTMILNAALLVHKDNMAEFDKRVTALDERVREKVSLKYIGPLPPFNFVNLIIEWN